MFALTTLGLFAFAISLLGLKRMQRPRADLAIQRRLASLCHAPSFPVKEEINSLDLIQDQKLNTRMLAVLAHNRTSAWLPTLLRESDCQWPILYVATCTLLGSVAVDAFIFLSHGGTLLAATSAGTVWCLPIILLRWKRQRRLAQFEAGLPEMMDLISRALQAGHSIQQAIEVASEQAPQPLRAELALVHRELSLGMPFRETMLSFMARVPIQDLRLCVTAILLQRQTGGDLVHVLSRTAYTIRERFRVMGEVKTFTAQGRLAGIIITALPILLFAVMLVLSPGYASPLIYDVIGRRLLWLAVCLLIIGGILVRHAVKVEV